MEQAKDMESDAHQYDDEDLSNNVEMSKLSFVQSVGKYAKEKSTKILVV